MGGCCCTARKPQLHGTPIYYYACPPTSEDRESLTSHHGEAATLTTGLLLDLNLDASIPDTYRSPPAPIPFDVVMGCPQTIDPGSVGDKIGDNSFEKINYMNMKELDSKAQAGTLLASPMKFGIEPLKQNEHTVSTTEEEDVCPTCLEEYDTENPRIITNCNHHFHLSCILEWMERSDTCPICNQEMEFEAL